jgi:hypothetical protein
MHSWWRTHSEGWLTWPKTVLGADFQFEFFSSFVFPHKLLNLTGPTRKVEINKKGGLDMAFQALKNHSNHAGVQGYACGLCWSLSLNSELKASLVLSFSFSHLVAV